MRRRGKSICVLLAIAASVLCGSPPPAAANPPKLAPSIGLSPRTAVVSGMSAPAAAQALANINACDDLHAQWAAAQAAADAAARDMAAAQQELSAAPVNEGARQRSSDASQRLEAAQTALEACRAATVTAAFDGLPPEQLEAFLRVREAAQPGTPPEFWILQRTPDEWQELRRALTQERRALRQGKPVPTGAATCSPKQGPSPPLSRLASAWQPIYPR